MSWGVQWKDWIAMFKVKVTTKDQNLSEYLSGWYFLNYSNLCIVMHHPEPESLKELELPSVRSKSQWVVVKINKTVSTVYWNADPFATKLNLMAHHVWFLPSSACWVQGQGVHNISQGQTFLDILNRCCEFWLSMSKPIVSQTLWLIIMYHHIMFDCKEISNQDML